MSSDDLTKSLDDHALLLQLVTLFREFDTRQREFGERLQSLDGRLQSLEERLHSLETKVDERLYDTRPMWEAVQVQITEVREQITEHINKLGEETEKGFRKLGSKIELLANEVRDLYADERELERRVGSLESKVS